MADIGKAYVQIIPKAEGISGSISSVIGGEASAAGITAGNALVSSLTGVIGAAAIGKVLSDSITTGMDFDKSISQVAATMGLTMDEMANQVGTVDTAWGEFNGNLREYAQFMGSNTAFSATEAADALNYMALAGYDAQTSMNMLPNVLNLAAAGDIDLASASDMVTDAQTALGLTLDETSVMVDQMAKTASKSNTSVAQLGDAYLKIGANARSLSGGTNELSAVLGVLADNGIKGSEAGTHLRNIILSLTPTTDKAAAAWEQLGVSGYDAQGKLRPLPDVFADLNAAMAGMTDQEKTDMFSAMFNKTDLASIKALVETTTGRYDELTTAIGNASGAAQQMADTQLDNLAGDVTLFQSALEGLQIALSDIVTPALRGVVDLGTELLSALTSALTEGDLTGLLDVGTSLMENIAAGFEQAPQRALMMAQMIEGMVQSVTENLPTLMSSGVEMVQGVLEGITQQLPSILEQGVQILTNIVNGILQNLPQLITTAGQLITTFTSFIIDNLPTILDAGVQLILNLVHGIIDNLPEIISAVLNVIKTFVTTIGEHLPEILKSGIEILAGLIAGLISAIPDLIAAIPEIIAAIFNTFAEVDWLGIGISILEGIAEGLINGIGIIIDAALNAAKAAFNAACDFLGINSPATRGIFLGEMLDEGFAVGINANTDSVEDAMTDMNDSVLATLETPATGRVTFENNTSNDDKMDTLLGILFEYLPEIASNKGVSVNDLYNGLNRQLGAALS